MATASLADPVCRHARKDLALAGEPTTRVSSESRAPHPPPPGLASSGISPWGDRGAFPQASLPEPTPPPAGPFCILFVGASNSDEDKLSIEREVKVIEEQFTKEWGADSWRHMVTFKHFFYADMQELVQGLLDYKPVGVHFVCHGFTSALSLFDDLVSVEKLAKALAAWARDDAFLRFVIANSCDSAALACALAEHVDFVIGHDRSVGDAAALEFARVLYRALGGGYPFDTSFELARATKGCSGYGLRTRKNASKFSFPKPKPNLHDSAQGGGEGLVKAHEREQQPVVAVAFEQPTPHDATHCCHCAEARHVRRSLAWCCAFFCVSVILSSSDIRRAAISLVVFSVFLFFCAVMVGKLRQRREEYAAHMQSEEIEMTTVA